MKRFLLALALTLGLTGIASAYGHRGNNYRSIYRLGGYGGAHRGYYGGGYGYAGYGYGLGGFGYGRGGYGIGSYSLGGYQFGYPYLGYGYGTRYGYPKSRRFYRQW